MDSACPQWNYDTVVGFESHLATVQNTVVPQLKNRQLDASACTKDTRPIHQRFFERLAPDGHKYYAGNYRGTANKHCLHHNVQVGSAQTTHYGFVASEMEELKKLIDEAIGIIDLTISIPSSQLKLETKLKYAIASVANVFCKFLQTHPYLDGNGHMARFIVIGILGKYNLFPPTWNIEPRPADPPYTDSIKKYMHQNDFGPLESFLFKCYTE